MIEKNLSHECYLLPEDNGRYDNLPGYEYYDIIHKNNIDDDNLTYKKCKEYDPDNGDTISRFAKKKDGTKGIIPQIELSLLDARSKVKGLMKLEKDPFVKKIYDGLQLAYKITANSLYGQTGADVSPIYLRAIAASTTATGRANLLFSRDTIVELYPGTVIVYGDTDSIFVKFPIKDEDGKYIQSKEALVEAIRLGYESSEKINKLLPYPHDLEYEKTYWPLISNKKKKYVGNLYVDDPDSYYQKDMGIVLTRRDNAQIVKVVCRGIIHKLLNERNAVNAVKFTKNVLKNILRGKYPIDKFVISKTLKGDYVDRSKHAHTVLADRMGIRDPGNKPQVNDRIPFVYIIPDGKVKLQGDRVEDPVYITEKNIDIDYLFYITNQIMKPAISFLEHLVENPEKIFKEFIVRELNKRAGVRHIAHYFGGQTVDDIPEFELFGEIQDSDKKPVEKKKRISKPRKKKVERKMPKLTKDFDLFD